MNTVTDLTARVVSYIGLKQDLYLSRNNKPVTDIRNMFTVVSGGESINLFLPMIATLQAGQLTPKYADFLNRATELVWISTDKEDKEEAARYVAHLFDKLAGWLTENKDKDCFGELRKATDIPTPNDWRTAISNLLYKEPKQRTALSKALHYLPLQIVLAIGGSEYDARGQRVMQSWYFWDKDEAEAGVSSTAGETVTAPHLSKEDIKFSTLR